jgi:diguanylate cyclase
MECLLSTRSLLARSGLAARAFRELRQTAADGPIQGRVRAEQISNVRRYLTPVMIANACNALVLVLALWSSPQRGLALAWACAVLAFTIYHYFRGRHSTRAKPSYVSHRPVSRAVRNALSLGSLWGILPLLFFSNASAAGKVIIACLCAGTLGGGVFAFASLPAAAIAFTAPIVVGSAIAIGRSGDPAYFLLAVLMVSYVAVLWRGVFLHAGEVARRIAKQIRAERKIRRDELTGLPNRIALFEALDKAFVRFSNLHEQFAVLYLDLNDFKNVNDRLGHTAGDRLLVEVGRRFRSCLRETDLVSRLSGDEFVVLVADIKSVYDAKTLAYALTTCLDASTTIDGTKVFTSACVGVAIAPDHGENSETLLKNADEALYAAKRGAGDVIQVYDAQYREQARRRRNLDRDLVRRQRF